MRPEHEAAPQPSGEILDACCGGRMWWWDKAHPLAVYMDKRTEERGAAGKWNPNWECQPDVLGDFRDMPFADESFQLVVFDPPHIVREVPKGGIGIKYGALAPATADDDLRRAFAECWRVLRRGGTMVFKWGATSVDRVTPHFPAQPAVGTRSARNGQTRWFVFYKPLDEAGAA